jgi:hypothetical protein
VSNPLVSLRGELTNRLCMTLNAILARPQSSDLTSFINPSHHSKNQTDTPTHHSSYAIAYSHSQPQALSKPLESLSRFMGSKSRQHDHS